MARDDTPRMFDWPAPPAGAGSGDPVLARLDRLEAQMAQALSGIDRAIGLLERTSAALVARQDAELVRLEDELGRLVEAMRRQREDDAVDRLDKQVTAIEERVAGIPAVSLPGLAVKARLAAYHLGEPESIEERLAASLCADCERLARACVP